MLVTVNSIRDFGTNPNKLIKENEGIIQKLAKISTISFCDTSDDRADAASWRSVGFADIALVHEKLIDIATERERLRKELARLEKALVSAERQLGNAAFLAKAPPHVVDGLRKQEADTRLLMEKTRRALEELGQEPR
jgi:valyl-tRNA synthetase